MRAPELTPSTFDSVPWRTGPIIVLQAMRHPSKQKIRNKRLQRMVRYPETF